MGLFDKIKEKASQIKEENKYFGSTMKRMNNRSSFYGNVNRGIKSGDFFEGSYVSIENGKAVIYGTAQADYVFGGEDVKNFTFEGAGSAVVVGQDKLVSKRFSVEFNDGKKAQIDIIADKSEAFKSTLKI